MYMIFLRYTSVLHLRFRSFYRVGRAVWCLTGEKHNDSAEKHNDSAMCNEGSGRLTGIRTWGRLGIQYQGLSSWDEGDDLAFTLLKALRCKNVRANVMPLLSSDEVETLQFVEKARELRQLCRTSRQERALRLAATLYKTYFLGGNHRKFDGIGQQDRTATTALMLERARSATEQLRSYAVLEEVLDIAAQKAQLMALAVIPKILVLDFDAIKQQLQDSKGGDVDVVLDALGRLEQFKPLGFEKWMILFRYCMSLQGPLMVRVGPSSTT